MSQSLPTILVVDDEVRSTEALARILSDEFTVLRAHSAAEALSLLDQEWVQVVISDQRMPDMTGVELLAEIRERWPDILRIIITGYTDAEDIIASINKAGIYHYLPKPWRPDELMQVVRRAAELYRLQREHDRLSLEMKLLAPTMETRLAGQREALKKGFQFQALIRAPHSPMSAVCQRAMQVASFNVPVLITGETGTGKELVARAIHYSSLRSDKPFFAFNCGAIPDELLESELFGHKKGSFTGAHSNRIGLLEQADGGTVFLDEIGDISPAFQVKLLRFLQEGEIRPVGSNETRTVNVRVLSATHRDLEADMKIGRFRQDLYFRLAVTAIHIPALRERADDIVLIARHVLDEAMAAHGKRVKGFSEEALACFQDYDWPGNVRQLQNEVVRMLVHSDSDMLGANLLTPSVLRELTGAGSFNGEAMPMGGPLRERVEAMEARILRETLIRLKWNKSRAADELGLSRVGLRAKLSRYGLVPAGEDETCDEED